MSTPPPKRRTESLDEPLTDFDLLSIRSRWTARNASPGQDWGFLYEQFRDAQNDLGRLLRHLGAFDGPPLQD